MNINPSSSVSGHHQPSDQARPAESPNDARPEASTSSRTFTGFFNTGFANLKRLFGKQAKCAPSDSHETAPAEDIAASSKSEARKRKRATSFDQFSELPHEIQSLIADKAAVAVVSRLPEESAQKLARLATVVRKVFRKSVQDIQERYPDIKRAGVRRRQESVKRRINMIIGSASSFTKFASALPTGNHVHMEEEIKKLLTGEPHVGVSIDAAVSYPHREQSHRLLKILSGKKDMESLHLTVHLKIGSFSRLEDSLSALEKINENNLKLQDVTLVIKGDDLNDKNVQALVAVLKRNRALQSLSLKSFRINAAVVGALADALKENRLHSLSLSDDPLERGVPLDVAGMQALADVLRENQSLQSLNLANTFLDAASVQTLADALKENHNLHSLDLSRVRLDAASMQALTDALKENHSLQSLDLTATSLRDEGAQAVVEALQKNKTLEVLNLSGSTFTFDGGQALIFALEENETLHSLVLTGAFYYAGADWQRLVDDLSKDVAARVRL